MFGMALGLLFLAGGARAGVIFSWDANRESDLAGYKLYYATFSLLGVQVSSAQALGSVRQVTFGGLGTTRGINTGASSLNPPIQAGQTYYFRLTAFNTSWVESEFNVDAAGQETEVVVPLTGTENADLSRVPKRMVSPNGDNINDTLTFGTNAQEADIYDLRGKRVRHLSGGGVTDLAWDLRDDGGRWVESGVYVAHLTDTAGARHYQTIAVTR
jgi:hypothetical protein